MSTAMSDESRELLCFIDGDDVGFVVDVHRDRRVSHLKEIIQSKRAMGILKDVDPPTMELWTVSGIDASRFETHGLFHLPFQPKDSSPIAAKPAKTLAERIRSLGDDLSDFADNLDFSDTIFSIFPNQPSSEHIHIIVIISE
jgi:hypothetical protein